MSRGEDVNVVSRSPRIAALLAMIAVVLTSGAVVAVEAAPDRPGPFPVEEMSMQLADPARHREMSLLLFFPSKQRDAENRAVQTPSPLIVFNHGFLLRAEVYRSYGEHLASHGFAVAMPTFPMTFFNVDHGELALDVRFVLDAVLTFGQDPSSPLFGRIDGTRIGLSGHSLGGKLSLLAAIADERIGAIGVLDPVDTGNPVFENPRRYPSVTPELMPQIHVPLLIIGAELGSELVSFSPCAPAADNYQRFFEAANPPAIEITQIDVGHGQYVDAGADEATTACAVGDVPDEWVRASSAGYLTAFFLHSLTGEATASPWLERQLVDDEQSGRVAVRRK